MQKGLLNISLMSSLVKPRNRSFLRKQESRKTKEKTGFPLKDCGNDNNINNVLLLMVSLVTIFFISSCTMPETKIYSIHIPNSPLLPPPKADKGEEEGFSANASIVIRVHSQRYLTQSYIAYRNSPYQLVISRYSKWESPPSDMVKDAFKDSFLSTGLFKEVRVSNTVPEGFYLLEINLKRFERSDAGNDSFGELVFDVNLSSPDGRELYRSIVSKKVNLDDKTFLSLAKGLSNALAEGIVEVKNSVVKYI